MSRTLRKNRDYKKTARDGYPWRGCDGGYCPVCSNNRQHKKIKEYIRGQEIIHEELIG